MMRIFMVLMVMREMCKKRHIDLKDDNMHKEPVIDDAVDSGLTIAYDPQNVEI
jgi:hypothetical protein